MSRHTPDGAPTWPPIPDYPANAFAGTARYYARYRVPYPQELIDDLRRRAEITGDGRLLDLACEPGRVALPLAPFFREVWAIDLEPEMVEVGREEARQCGATNVRWMGGRAEEVEALPGSFELITIGEAFHRLDQRLIVQRALEWLPPGRCLATLGCDSVFKGHEQWQALGTEVRSRWTGQGLGTGPKPASQPLAILRTAGFEDVANYEFQMPYVWTLEAIIGNLYSTSVTSNRALGDKAAAFEDDVRRMLLAYDARGQYPATLSFGYTLARRPTREAERV